MVVQCIRQYNEQSWLQYSEVHQWWRQETNYTALEAPSCWMNRNCLYLCCDRLHQYTDFALPFCGKIDLYWSIWITDIHWVFFSFSFPRNGTDTFSSSHVKFQQFFPINFSCEGSLFFVQSSKPLSTQHLGCEQGCFYQTGYILADLGLPGKLLTKRASFLVHPSLHGLRESHHIMKLASPFSPAIISLASLHASARH